MDRRELLKMIALLTGGAMVGGDLLLSGCKNPYSIGFVFTDGDIAFLDEMAETILPATNTPGAKEAGVGRFMTVIVNDCYEEKDQKAFHEGIQKLDDACNEMHHAKFMKLSPEDRHKLLHELDKEAKEYQKKKSDFDKQQNELEKNEIAKGNK
jgi:hypothetical protein